MRSFFKGSLLAVLAVIAIVSFVPMSNSAISLFTRPGGTNPINFPSVLGDMNTLINNINAAVSTYLFFNNSGEPGEMNITSSTAFAANGSVNTGLTAVGPVGSHTTVQKWLIVIDGSGNQLFAPLF